MQNKTENPSSYLSLILLLTSQSKRMRYIKEIEMYSEELNFESKISCERISK